MGIHSRDQDKANGTHAVGVLTSRGRRHTIFLKKARKTRKKCVSAGEETARRVVNAPIWPWQSVGIYSRDQNEASGTHAVGVLTSRGRRHTICSKKRKKRELRRAEKVLVVFLTHRSGLCQLWGFILGT